MTPTGPAPLPDPREEEVRRRLADARHVEPVPVDVASRLDRVLAQLAEGEDVPVTSGELAVRRRRRAAGLLAAAAAVAVVGVGLGQVLPGTTGMTGAADDAAGGSAGSVAAERPAPAGSSTEEGAGNGRLVEGGASADSVPPRPQVRLTYVAPGGGPVRIRAARFAADALRVRTLVDAPGRGDRTKGPGGGVDREEPDEQALFECTPADWGTGLAVAVLYDGEPHVLVLRAPAGDSQVADLLQCGTGDILRSTTLPAG